MIRECQERQERQERHQGQEGDGRHVNFTAMWESGLDKARAATQKTLLLSF